MVNIVTLPRLQAKSHNLKGWRLHQLQHIVAFTFRLNPPDSATRTNSPWQRSCHYPESSQIFNLQRFPSRAEYPDDYNHPSDRNLAREV